MARKHSKSMKKRTHKGRRHRGGGWGFTGPQSIPGTPGTVSNPQVFTGIGDCRAVKPGYDIPYSQYGASFKGLPGMSGGKRRKSRKGSKGKKTRKQRGGRYGFFPESIGTITPNGAAWWAGTYPPIQRIACEGSTPNPLNPGPHTPSTQPTPVASSRIPMPQTGGGQLAPATYGVGNVDSMYYYAPTAGYANTASTWKDSVGAPVQIQVPFAARAMNQACLTTGGHPPLTGALQKGGRRSRKQRGGVTLPTMGNITGIFGKGKNALLGLFGQKNTGIPAEVVTEEIVSEPTPNSVAVTEVAAVEVPPPKNVNIALRNRKAPSLPLSNVSGATRTNAPIPGSAPNAGSSAFENEAPLAGSNNSSIVMGGKRKKRHHKKRTHKRRQ